MPRMARRAARVAFGGDAQMTVWDHEYDYGYRLYKNSARKLKPELPHPAREGAGSGGRGVERDEKRDHFSRRN